MDDVFLYVVCADRNGMIPPYDFVSDFVLIEFLLKGLRKSVPPKLKSFCFFYFRTFYMY